MAWPSQAAVFASGFAGRATHYDSGRRRDLAGMMGPGACGVYALADCLTTDTRRVNCRLCWRTHAFRDAPPTEDP